jgi:hypothetical protein
MMYSTVIETDLPRLELGDLSPNVGLWWYFFTEMFDHFRPFFLAIFSVRSVLADDARKASKTRYRFISVYMSCPSASNSSKHRFIRA